MTKQEYFKSTIAQIKDTQPKEFWPRMIAAAKAAPLPAAVMLETTPSPCNTKTTKADIQRAKNILESIDNYIVRYVRHPATVALGIRPARNADGGIIADAPAIKQRVICSGVPYGCMIAFIYTDQLFIGWSKRIETRQFTGTGELRSLFRRVLDSSIPKTGSEYNEAFDLFSKKLIGLLSCQPFQETEISFSKSAGRVAAVVRGLKDSIIVNGKHFDSAASGPIPSEIAKQLAQFIEYAEQAYGNTAINVGNPDSLPAVTKAESSSIAVA
jgi:hypothetical protein